MYLSLSLPLFRPVCLFFYLSVHTCIYLSLSLSICVCIWSAMSLSIFCRSWVVLTRPSPGTWFLCGWGEGGGEYIITHEVARVFSLYIWKTLAQWYNIGIKKALLFPIAPLPLRFSRQSRPCRGDMMWCGGVFDLFHRDNTTHYSHKESKIVELFPMIYPSWPFKDRHIYWRGRQKQPYWIVYVNDITNYIYLYSDNLILAFFFVRNINKRKKQARTTTTHLIFQDKPKWCTLCTYPLSKQSVYMCTSWIHLTGNMCIFFCRFVQSIVPRLHCTQVRKPVQMWCIADSVQVYSWWYIDMKEGFDCYAAALVYLRSMSLTLSCKNYFALLLSKQLYKMFVTTLLP